MPHRFMTMNRRQFLQLAGAGAGAMLLPRLAFGGKEQDGFTILEARPGKARLKGRWGPATDIWGYGGTVPGPELRVRQGEEVRVRLVNRLSQPTSIHWHGVRTPNAMDGVPGLTQKAVAPGESFDYVFTPPDAGTFWYHPHIQTYEQVARGLYGILIVEEKEAPAFDRDLTLVIDDWRLRRDGQIDAASFTNMGDWSHGGRYGNWPTVNGRYQPVLPLTPGERVRLRLVNCCNARILSLTLRGQSATIIALDGQPVAPLETGERPIYLAPAQRVDLALDASLPAGSEVSLVEAGQDLPVDLARFRYGEKPSATRAGRAPVSRLADNPLSDRLSLSDAYRIDIALEGGAMGGMRSARYRGKTMSIRELVDNGQVWALNGEVGIGDKPIFDVERGRTVVMTLHNQTAFPHPMHAHGHHFRVIAQNGKPVKGAPWRDTELIFPRDKVSLAFVADNPGKWAFHCHTLEHAQAGMITWFNVQA